jgi:hypothetical protein
MHLMASDLETYLSRTFLFATKSLKLVKAIRLTVYVYRNQILDKSTNYFVTPLILNFHSSKYDTSPFRLYFSVQSESNCKIIPEVREKLTLELRTRHFSLT